MMLQLVRNRHRAPVDALRRLFSPQSSRWIATSSDDLSDNWTYNHRTAITYIVKSIQNNQEIIKKARDRFIAEDIWHEYLLTFRRNLIKNPLALMNDNQAVYEELSQILSKFSFTGVRHPLNAVVTLTQSDVKLVNVCHDIILPVLFENAEIDLADSIASTKSLSNTSDLSLPHDWYPKTRLMKRKIIFHGGPTNSGKTYQAIQALKATTGNGIYCGPLRLLALEVYEKLNKDGIYCDLLTGQEVQEVPFSTHTSCTVEMVDINKDYDVAVVDEIQMIADSQRGHAWTRVLLGLPAREIHLCGGLEAAEIVEKLVSVTGDEFVLQRYDRLSTLKIDSHSLGGDYSKVRPGDCVVAFSKQDIFSIRKQIEKMTPYKCAVIYGQLPPDIRSAQARLFNEGNGYEILVASDAIGMGLNLQIGRIIFHTTTKKQPYTAPALLAAKGQRVFDRPKFAVQRIDPSHIKQIAGRAGRMNSKFAVGEVTTWQDFDLAYVRAVMSFDVPSIKAAGIFPSSEQMEKFSDLMIKARNDQQCSPTEDDRDIEFDGAPEFVSEKISGGMSDLGVDEEEMVEERGETMLSAQILNKTKRPSGRDQQKVFPFSFVMSRFVELAKIDGRYFMCDFEASSILSNWLHTIPLSLQNIYKITTAPINIRDPNLMEIIYTFAAQFAQGKPVALNVRFGKKPPQTVDEFIEFCSKHSILELYLWLSFRFPDYFIERDICLEQMNYSNKTIKESLFAGKFSQSYSHSERYSDLFKKFDEYLEDESAEVHPNSAAIKAILLQTREYLEAVAPHQRCQLPHKELELAEVGSMSHRRHTNNNQHGDRGYQRRSSMTSRHSRSDEKKRGMDVIQYASPTTVANTSSSNSSSSSISSSKDIIDNWIKVKKISDQRDADTRSSLSSDANDSNRAERSNSSSNSSSKHRKVDRYNSKSEKNANSLDAGGSRKSDQGGKQTRAAQLVDSLLI